MNDEFLTNFREAPRPEFAAALYKRISRPMVTQSSISLRRLAITFSVLALTLAAVLFASPGARALAADLLRQIGILTISSRPVGEPVIIAPASPEQMELAQATATPISPGLHSGTLLAKAIAEAGFAPYLPGYLPAGYTQVSIVAAQYLDDGQIGHGMGIFADYRSEEGGYLSIQTNRFNGREQDIPAGGLSVMDVTVNGQPAVWIEDLPTVSTLVPGGTLDMLLWEEEGFVIAIQTDQLSREEVLQIAGSLSQ